MPKVDIDYSNTIFYKIFCKESSNSDMYIGHTTNFVQRKHAHKQSCINTNAANHKCKLYNAIREHKGWDNWTMEIIAFHDCEDHYSARKKEQSYFEQYKATLNSIEPLPPPKIKVLKVKKEKVIRHCDTCDKTFLSLKQFDSHHITQKHIKNLQKQPTTVDKRIPKIYNCETCNYVCYRVNDFSKHLSTAKHNNRMHPNELVANVASKFVCKCGKTYNHMSSLCNHKRTCNVQENPPVENTFVEVEDKRDKMIEAMMKDSQEMKNLIIMFIKNQQEVLQNQSYIK